MNEFDALKANLEHEVEHYGADSMFAKRRQRELEFAYATARQMSKNGTLDPLALAVMLNTIHDLIQDLDDRIDPLERR